MLSPALMVTDVGAALIEKSVTSTGKGHGERGQGNVVKPPPFTLRLGVTSNDFVPTRGVSTTVTVAFPATATLPIWQTTVAFTGV